MRLIKTGFHQAQPIALPKERVQGHKHSNVLQGALMLSYVLQTVNNSKNGISTSISLFCIDMHFATQISPAQHQILFMLLLERTIGFNNIQLDGFVHASEHHINEHGIRSEFLFDCVLQHHDMAAGSSGTFHFIETRKAIYEV